MMTTALTFLLEAVIHIFVFAALTRFFMQAFRTSAKNPLAQFSIALTDFLVKPLRRIVPGLRGMDWASLIAAWIAEFFLWVAIALILGFPLFAQPLALSALGLYAAVKLLRLTVYLFMAAIFIQVILSWVAPYHPFAGFIKAFSDPLLKPLQRRMPLIGGVDISPIFVLIGLQLILLVPVSYFETETWRMLRTLTLP
jgi:YggT family protein